MCRQTKNVLFIMNEMLDASSICRLVNLSMWNVVTCMRIPSLALLLSLTFVQFFVPFAVYFVSVCVRAIESMHVAANVTECCFPLVNYSHHWSISMYLSGLFYCIHAMRRLCIVNRCHTNSVFFSPKFSIPYFMWFVCNSFAY